MEESVAVAKEADAKKGVSPTRSDNSIFRLRDEPERQLGSLRGVINNIRHDGGTPSVDSIATQLSGMSMGGRAPALLALQQTHGNRYVQRVVAGIQAKLVVGQPGDMYEQEADRVANAVMRMPEPHVQRQPEKEDLIQTKPLVDQITPLIQRQVEEKKEEEEELQAKELPGQTSEVTPNLESRINAIRGGGQHLPAPTRAFFEPRFGYDFSQVRVHTDAEANTFNHSLNARAFTTGQDIFFRQGVYNSSSSSGQELLAHELTHVVQQGDGAIHSHFVIQRNNIEVSEEEAIRVGSTSEREVPQHLDWELATIERSFHATIPNQSNRFLILMAVLRNQRLLHPSSPMGPQEQSAIAETLILIYNVFDALIQAAPKDENRISEVEGLEWDPDDPNAGLLESISPFGMLDVWTTFVRRPPERPARRRRPVRSIEMEEEEITVPRIEMEEEEITVPRRPRRRLPLTSAECAVGEIAGVRGIPSGGRYFYGIHTTQHGTICYGRYDCATDTCSPRWMDRQGNVVYMVEYNEGIDDQRNGCVSRERYRNDAAYRAGVDSERRWGQARGGVRWGSSQT